MIVFVVVVVTFCVCLLLLLIINGISYIINLYIVCIYIYKMGVWWRRTHFTTLHLLVLCLFPNFVGSNFSNEKKWKEIKKI